MTGTIKKFNRTVGGLAGQTYQYGRIRESYSEVNLIMDPTFDASVVGGPLEVAQIEIIFMILTPNVRFHPIKLMGTC